ncbi:MAG: hypothetical protein FWD75_06660 [Propionibacteriaceae bacterium]|nr:hypothetical protein [Propionibacteriaceae bacterium]
MRHHCPSCGQFANTTHHCPVTDHPVELDDLGSDPGVEVAPDGWSARLWELALDREWLQVEADFSLESLWEQACDWPYSVGHPYRSRLQMQIGVWDNERVCKPGVWDDPTPDELDALTALVVRQGHGWMSPDRAWRAVEFEGGLHVVPVDMCVCCGQRHPDAINGDGLCHTCATWPWDAPLPAHLQAVNNDDWEFDAAPCLPLDRSLDDVWVVDARRGDYARSALTAIPHAEEARVDLRYTRSALTAIQVAAESLLDEGEPLTVDMVAEALRATDLAHDDAGPTMDDDERRALIRRTAESTRKLAVIRGEIVRVDVPTYTPHPPKRAAQFRVGREGRTTYRPGDIYQGLVYDATTGWGRVESRGVVVAVDYPSSPHSNTERITWITPSHHVRHATREM